MAAYVEGDPVDEIAGRFGVGRTTVISHVTRQGLPRRSDHGWSESELRSGHLFGVDPTTVAKRFRRFAIPIRPRRGWS